MTTVADRFLAFLKSLAAYGTPARPATKEECFFVNEPQRLSDRVAALEANATRGDAE